MTLIWPSATFSRREKEPVWRFPNRPFLFSCIEHDSSLTITCMGRQSCMYYYRMIIFIAVLCLVALFHNRSGFAQAAVQSKLFRWVARLAPIFQLSNSTRRSTMKCLSKSVRWSDMAASSYLTTLRIWRNKRGLRWNFVRSNPVVNARPAGLVQRVALRS